VEERGMRFVFLTETRFRWDEQGVKGPELVAAALAAGFNAVEVEESVVGSLEQEFTAGGWVFKAGARALVGWNGSTLVEVS
jgi:hypothetical protein